MKESIGNAYVFGIFALFAFLTLFILTVSINYSRASKIKDRLLTVVQNYAESSDNIATDSSGRIDVIDFESDDFKEKINYELAAIGYRRNNGGYNQNNCTKNEDDDSVLVLNPNSEFKYCIYAYPTSRGWYYGVTTYMYFDIPIIGSTLEFPIYGETKVIYQLDGI